MFVPVACLTCGKPFQVPEAAAGTTVACPWCKAATPALPVAGLPAPPPNPPAVPPDGSQPELLTLDDEPPVELPVRSEPGGSHSPPAGTRQQPRKPFPFKTAIVVLLLSTVCGVGTFLVVGVVRGRIPMPGRGVDRISDSAWKDFTPPDNSCTVSLPGTPTEADSPISPGKVFTTSSWFTGVTSWVGWVELEGEWLQKATAPDAWVHLRPRFDAIRDKHKADWNATVTKETTTKFENPLTVEVHMQTADGALVERFVVVTAGPKPRLYYMGLVGRGVTADGPAAKKLFESFRPA